MKINIVGKNVTVTEGMRTKIEEKLQKLEKYEFIKPDMVCNVLVRTVKDDQIIEVTIPLEGKKMIRAEKRDKSLYAAVDLVEATLSRQIRKMKEKRIGTKRNGTVTEPGAEAEDPVFIARERTVLVETLSPEEAVTEMEMLDHDFHIFTEKATGRTAVVYRRRDGSYGLIHT